MRGREEVAYVFALPLWVGPSGRGAFGLEAGKPIEVRLGKVSFPRRAAIKARIEASAPRGAFTLLAGASLRLLGPSEISIPMPCSIVVSAECLRVQAIIPGFDDWLEIEGGEYEAQLKIEPIVVSGSGTLEARLLLLAAPAPKI